MDQNSLNLTYSDCYQEQGDAQGPSGQPETGPATSCLHVSELMKLRLRNETLKKENDRLKSQIKSLVQENKKLNELIIRLSRSKKIQMSCQGVGELNDDFDDTAIESPAAEEN